MGQTTSRQSLSSGPVAGDRTDTQQKDGGVISSIKRWCRKLAKTICEVESSGPALPMLTGLFHVLTYLSMFPGLNNIRMFLVVYLCAIVMIIVVTDIIQPALCQILNSTHPISGFSCFIGRSS
ncbi:hypothetical protein EGW08_017605 [Elysia chlorotica]|uniref:Uncharacterized protein n=1 Tax=Elysia chlorotica TaxID=188477 RepID=A0A433SZ93_ELYCH|nr:hypothetical protein EGW08_017605 [Elysia chlorotica]